MSRIIVALRDLAFDFKRILHEKEQNNEELTRSFYNILLPTSVIETTTFHLINLFYLL